MGHDPPTLWGHDPQVLEGLAEEEDTKSTVGYPQLVSRDPNRVKIGFPNLVGHDPTQFTQFA